LFSVIQGEDVKEYFDDDDEISSISTMSYEELLQSDLLLYDNLNDSQILAFTKKITKHQIYLLKYLYPLVDFNELIKSTNSNSTIDLLSPLLQELIVIENVYLNSIIKSKNRDTLRGSTIIPDYLLVNKSAKDGDDVIKIVEPRINNYIQLIQSFLSQISSK